MFPAQRFESLSKSENLGLASLKDIKGSAVYNTVTNKLEEVSGELKGIVSSLTQGINPPLDDIKNKVEEGLRVTKDTFSTLRDLTNISPRDIENSISDMLPDNPVLQNAFRQLSSQCRDNALGNIPNFRGFKDNASCGQPGQGKCSSSQVSGLLSKLTGGAIGSIVQSLGSMLKSLMTLANLGYTAGLCKIFGALASSMPGGVIQKAAAGAMALAAGRGNVTAVFDIASGMKSSIPSLEIPSLVNRVTEGFKIPASFNSSKDQLFDATMGTYSLVDPTFSSGSLGLKSISKLSPDKYNTEFASVSKSHLTSGFSVRDISTPVRKEYDSLAAAYVGSKVASKIKDTLGFFNI